MTIGNARRLYIDIETSPNLGLVWSLWNQNISLPQLLESGDMLCFAAAWDDKPKKPIFYSIWTHSYEEMVNGAWDLLNAADLVVHFNGRKFDIPWLQRLFVEAEFPPPSPYRQVDLCAVVRKEFRFPSNKLAYVAERLLGQEKIKTDFSLWTSVMNGDPKAQKEMRKYCINDTLLLHPLHNRLLPWIPSYPSMAVITGEMDTCPKCGSDKIQKRGLAYTQARTYQQFCCTSCGSWSRSSRCEPGSATITQVRNS